MLFARWQHHLRFCSGFPYAPLKAMVTKISKWSRIQDSFRITPKIESLVVCAMPDIPSKFQKDPSITFWVILLTDRQTNKQTNKVWQITSLAEVKIHRKKLKRLIERSPATQQQTVDAIRVLTQGGVIGALIFAARLAALFGDVLSPAFLRSLDVAGTPRSPVTVFTAYIRVRNKQNNDKTYRKFLHFHLPSVSHKLHP